MLKQYKMLFSHNEFPYVICYEMDTSVIEEDNRPGSTGIHLTALNVPDHSTASDEEVERTVAYIARNGQQWVNDHAKELVNTALMQDMMDRGDMFAINMETGQFLDPVSMAMELARMQDPLEATAEMVPAGTTRH